MKKTIVRPSPEEKQHYLDDAQKYADNLVEKLDNEEGVYYFVSCFYFMFVYLFHIYQFLCQ